MKKKDAKRAGVRGVEGREKVSAGGVEGSWTVTVELDMVIDKGDRLPPGQRVNSPALLSSLGSSVRVTIDWTVPPLMVPFTLNMEVESANVDPGRTVWRV